MPDSDAKEVNTLSRYLSAIKARIGEKSIPPAGGSILLKGAKIESDICMSNVVAGC